MFVVVVVVVVVVCSQLAHDVVPKTVENFMQLCNGTKQFSYKGTKIVDILKEASLRLGDVETNNGTVVFC